MVQLAHGSLKGGKHSPVTHLMQKCLKVNVTEPMRNRMKNQCGSVVRLQQKYLKVKLTNGLFKGKTITLLHLCHRSAF